MARGYCFEICKDRDALYSFSEDSLYDLCGQEFDYVQEVDESSKERETKYLFEMLRQYGFTEVWDRDEEGGIFHGFIVQESDRLNYFRPRLEQLKKEVASLTLPEFIKGGVSTRIRNIITDDYSDCVYYGYFRTMDDFIRDAEAETTYWVGNVVYMH